jgi:hypothetical protein
VDNRNFVLTIEIDGLSDQPGSDNLFDTEFNTFLQSLLTSRLIAGYTYNKGPEGGNPIVANS